MDLAKKTELGIISFFTNSVTHYESSKKRMIELKEGEKLDILPPSNFLVGRSYLAVRDGDGYTVIETEYGDEHIISYPFVKLLSDLDFDDEEICEIFIHVHESLKKYSKENGMDFEQEEIAEQLAPIILNYNPRENILNEFLKLRIEQIYKIMVAKDPYKKFNSFIKINSSDDYDDGNEKGGTY